jgi:monothiol glutaredoxin
MLTAALPAVARDIGAITELPAGSDQSSMWTKDDIQREVENHKVLVFGKGTKTAPQCGFTMRAIQVLEACKTDFDVINIFDDPSIRPALVEYSGWPTTPQVFVAGEFVGGSDIVLEMYQAGELQTKLEGVAQPKD